MATSLPASDRGATVSAGEEDGAFQSVLMMDIPELHPRKREGERQGSRRGSAVSVARGRGGGRVRDLIERFEPPSRGTFVVAQATMTRAGVRKSIGVIYYSVGAEARVVYPFERELMGEVWSTSEETDQCTFRNVLGERPLLFLSRKLGLPVEVVETLMVSIDERAGPWAESKEIEAWRNDLWAPNSSILFEIPCRKCGVVLSRPYQALVGLGHAPHGVECAELGQACSYLREGRTEVERLLPLGKHQRAHHRSCLYPGDPPFTTPLIQPAHMSPDPLSPPSANPPPSTHCRQGNREVLPIHRAEPLWVSTGRVGFEPTVAHPTTLYPSAPHYPLHPTSELTSGRQVSRSLTLSHVDARTVDPAFFVKGVLAQQLVSPPPSDEDVAEMKHTQMGRAWEDLTQRFNRHLQSGAIAKFSGSGDAKEYATWRNSLLLHYARFRIVNTAIQAALAVGSLVGDANAWWLSHYLRCPNRDLSLDQLFEWVRTELVPTADPDMAVLEWNSLRFDGDLDQFFAKMQDLLQYNPLPPRQAQVLAAQRFGPMMVTRVQSAMAQAGTNGLTRVQWETMVRAFVMEQEAKGSFVEWAQPDSGPVHRRHKTFPPAATPRREGRLFATGPIVSMSDNGDGRGRTGGDSVPKREGFQLKRGKGEAPCYVCGLDDHRWYNCHKRKKGRCAVCGAESHLTRDCAQRYHPEGRPNSSAGSATVRTADVVEDDEQPEVFCVAVGDDKAEGNGTDSPGDDEAETPPSLEVDPADPAGDSGVGRSSLPEKREDGSLAWGDNVGKVKELVAAMCVNAVDAGIRPRWVTDCFVGSQQMVQKQDGQEAVHRPNKPNHLYYRVFIDGREVVAMLDNGATRSFMSQEWADRNSLRVTPLPKPMSLIHFKGRDDEPLLMEYKASRLTLARVTVPWSFLVLPDILADVVLGLDYMKWVRVYYDPESDYVYVKGPRHPQTRGLAIETSLADAEEEGDADVDEREVEEGSMCFVDTVKETTPLGASPGWRIIEAGNKEMARTEVAVLSVTARSAEELSELHTFRESLSADLLHVIDDAPTLFAPPDKEPPARSVKHHIRLLPDTLPIKRRPYPLPPHKLQELQTQMSALVENGWVERSESPWGAPILFVPKKNNTLRMCVDYRDLNAVTVDDSYPLPRIEVLLHRASKATVFTKLDLASGFHQIEVAPESRPMTAFRLPEAVCGSSLWQWKVMPFGLRNAPPTFQRAMAVALEGCDHCSVVYIDDILIFSETREQHLNNLREVFDRLVKHSYHARLQKCEFLQPQVEFLGHVISAEGIRTHPDKVDALRQWPIPLSSASQVKSFLGLVMWYRAFIPHLATIATPLFELTSSKTKFRWSTDCEIAARRLQGAVTEAPVLARWEWARDTRVTCDASKVGIGGVLEQRHDLGWKPIAFWSRKLKDAETRYCATDLEWLAIVTAVTRVWYWLLDGKTFVICSDHKALERKLCKSAHDPPINDRQARWIESMARYSFTFQWITGKENVVADALSRNPVGANTTTVIHAMVVGMWQRLKLATEGDTEYQALLAKASDPGCGLSVWRGLVTDEVGRIFVPNNAELRTLILGENHSAPWAGHFGAEKTQALVERHWQWKGMARDVREFVRSCTSCQRMKHTTHPSPGRLQPIVARRPWQIVTMDFVTGLPPARRGSNEQILVIIDKFSKYVCLEPCPASMDAGATAAVVIKRVVRDFGIPRVVLTDRGPQFDSEVWRCVFERLGAKVALASTHHPQTDGQTERAIQTLRRLLRSYVRTVPDRWEELLPTIQFAMNNAPSAAGRYSPFQVLYGESPVVPSDLLLDDDDARPASWEVGDRSAVAWVRRWWKARRRLHGFVRVHLQRAADIMKRRYDRRHPTLVLDPGDLVMVSGKAHPHLGDRRKYRPRYYGPYPVVRRVNHNAYELSGLPTRVPAVQNVEYLRLFYPTPARFASRPDAQYARPVDCGDHHEWEVEAIDQHRQTAHGIRYLIKWVGSDDRTWLLPR